MGVPPAWELPAVAVADHQAEATLFVQDGAFDLLEDGAEPDLTLPDYTNGLADPYRGGLLITTGIHTGAIAVRVEAHLSAPPPEDPNGWDDSVEVSTHCPVGRLHVRTPGADVPTGLPTLSRAGPGWYLVRVFARGRDLHPDGTTLKAVEHYLIQVWLATPAA